MNLEKRIDNFREDIIRSTQEILKIRSVEEEGLPGKPFGEGINNALEYALNLCKKLGLKTGNLDGYAGYGEYGEGKETMGILVHLDVVPEGSGWTYPPYGAEIHDGRIYARGAIDDKGPAVAALYGLKAVMDSGLPLSKKVRVIFGCDEESGWQDIDYYREKEKMPDFGLSPDGSYPIINTEKGILHLLLSKSFTGQGEEGYYIKELKGGTRANVVPDEARCILALDGKREEFMEDFHAFQKEHDWKMKLTELENNEWQIESFGVSAHGSTPEKGQNAVSQLILLLDRMVGFGNSEQGRYIHFLASSIGMETDGRGMGVKFSDEVSGKLTLNLGVVEWYREEAKVTIDIRYPISYKERDIVKIIQERADAAGAKVQVVSSQLPLHVPEDHFLVKKLKEVYTQLTGEQAYTIAIGGGTYARALSNAVAFGPLFPGKVELAHQRDEYIEIEDLILNGKIYAKAIYELAK